MGNNWHTEEAGMLAVQAAAHTARWISRDQTKHDFGIDLNFELTDERGDATGRLLAIQVKSGQSWFANPATSGAPGWWFKIGKKHKRYWLNHSLPVILALHDDQTQETYWVHVTSDVIESTRFGNPRILVPSEQVLDQEAFGEIAAIANRRGPGSTDALVHTPARHRVVLRDAMEAAARDDARVAFEQAQAIGPLLIGNSAYHMGDPMGRYVLTAYREFDEFLALVLVVNHLAALNKLLVSAGKPAVSLQMLLKGFGMAMPNDADPQEVAFLKQYIDDHAVEYWGGPL